MLMSLRVLSLSPNVGNHAPNIFTTLHVVEHPEAIVRAREAGLTNAPTPPCQGGCDRGADGRDETGSGPEPIIPGRASVGGSGRASAGPGRAAPAWRPGRLPLAWR